MDLPRASQREAGICPNSVDAFVSALAAKKLDVHSLMIVRDGHVAVEGWWKPYEPKIRHQLFSLTKSFMSTAVGFAVQEGLVTLDEPVGAVFTEKRIQDRTLTLRHLLTMSAGHDPAPWMDEFDDWVAGFLDHPRVHEPGTQFLYSTPASCVAGAVVEARSGMDLLQYLTPRLLNPLGIDGSQWERLRGDIVAGGYGLSLTTEEVAKFGLFVLNRGEWQGRRLLQSSWFDEATRFHISNGDDPNNDWNQGYGFQFWRCRHNCFRGDGAFGQFCVAVPAKKAVIVMTSGVGDLQGVLDEVWNHLLPGLETGGQGHISLKDLTLAGPSGLPSGAHLERRRFSLEANDQGLERIEVEANEETASLLLDYGLCDRRITAGFRDWADSGSAVVASIRGGDLKATPCKAKAAWADSETLSVRTAFVETPFAPTYTVWLSEDECRVTVTGDHSFSHPPEWPPIQGRRIS
jgi:CubicO group peptidase (beta-lactamase class C family)